MSETITYGFRAATGLQYSLDEEAVRTKFGGGVSDFLNLQKPKGTLSASLGDGQDAIVFGPDMQHAIGVGLVIVTDFETGVAGDALTITPFFATGEGLPTPPVPEPPRYAEARFVAAVLAAAAAAAAPSRRLR